jgi:hypothetical protein
LRVRVKQRQKSHDWQLIVVYQREVVDFRVAVDVVHDRAHLLDVRVDLELSLELVKAVSKFIIRVGDLSFLEALGLVFVADDLDTSLAISAEEGEASGKDNDGITADKVPSAGSVGDCVEVGSPVLVSDSRSTVSVDSNILKDFERSNIDVAEDSETTSKTDTGDVEEAELSLSLDLSEVVDNIVADCSPHVVVGLLDFAVFAGSLIDDLERIENVLPNIQYGVGVAEG